MTTSTIAVSSVRRLLFLTWNGRLTETTRRSASFGCRTAMASGERHDDRRLARTVPRPRVHHRSALIEHVEARVRRAHLVRIRVRESEFRKRIGPAQRERPPLEAAAE